MCTTGWKPGNGMLRCVTSTVVVKRSDDVAIHVMPVEAR